LEGKLLDGNPLEEDLLLSVQEESFLGRTE
jgi:hypothetical protein